MVHRKNNLRCQIIQSLWSLTVNCGGEVIVLHTWWTWYIVFVSEHHAMSALDPDCCLGLSSVASS